MTNFRVFDFEFRLLGTVAAYDSEQALIKAKKKFKGAVAPMVERVAK